MTASICPVGRRSSVRGSLAWRLLGGCCLCGVEAPSGLLEPSFLPPWPTCLQLLEIRLYSQKEWAHGFLGVSNATQKDFTLSSSVSLYKVGGCTVREGVGGTWKLRTKTTPSPVAWHLEAAGAPGGGLSLWESVSNMRLILFSPVAINWEKYFKAV